MLTPRQQQVLDTIRSYQEEKGVSPSISTLCTLLGVSSKNSVHKMLVKLEQKGHLARTEDGRVAFLPSLMEKIQEMGKTFASFPLLGTVKAGYMDAADEEVRDEITLDGYLVKKPHDTFLWEVSGDSMIDAGIEPGDLVLVERNLTPKIGDIVLAWVDGGNTLKRYARRDGKICLLAENPKYRPIFPKHELMIPGVVVGLIRKYR